MVNRRLSPPVTVIRDLGKRHTAKSQSLVGSLFSEQAREA